MISTPEPMDRTYTPEEWAAARRRGITTSTRRGDPGGPLLYATGPAFPATARNRAKAARKEAADWELVADAADREWMKE